MYTKQMTFSPILLTGLYSNQPNRLAFLKRIVVIITAGLLLSGCSHQKTIVDKTYPALWEVEISGKGKVWLFGTLHSLPDDTNSIGGKVRSRFVRFPPWVSPETRGALHTSELIVLELSPESGVDISASKKTVEEVSNSLRPGPAVLASVNNEQRAIILEAARRRNLTFEDIKELSAESMLALFSTLPQKDTSSRSNNLESAENWLNLYASRKRKKIEGLESVSDRTVAIMDSFTKLDDSLKNQVLVDFVATSSSSSVDEDIELRRIYARWTAGDVEKIYAQRALFHEQYPEIYEAFLGARNRLWVPKIEEHINSGKNVFIAVGDGHLIGPGSIRELLETLGYSIKRIN